MDNTSDASKPVSTAQQAALDLKANDSDVVHDTGNETIAGVKTFSSDPLIPDEAYGSAWNGVLEPPTKNAVYDQLEATVDNSFIKALQAGGSVIKAETVGLTMMDFTSSIGNGLVDARAWYTAVYLNKVQTITGVKWYQVTQGNYTADSNNYVGLYSYSAGTLTQVAISANDGNIWKAAANTIGSAAFTSPYAAAAGLYFVGILYNNSAQVTAPVLMAKAVGNNTQLTVDMTNSVSFFAAISSQSTLPATQACSGLTSLATGTFWLGLY